jgi:hypothetical protein
MFAGMLMGKPNRDTKSPAMPVRDELVSWCAGAQSRREDELARSRQAALH